jgi:hypothetical protein
MLFAGPKIFYIAFVPVAKDTFSSISDTKYPTLQSQYVVRAVQVQLYRDRFAAGPRNFLYCIRTGCEKYLFVYQEEKRIV